jgi:N-carbamoylputrescine amidase
VKLGLIQQHATADLASNLRRGLEAAGRAADQGAQLVAFAELAFTPFYPQSPPSTDVRSLAEQVPGPTTEAFQKFARDRGVVVIINLLEQHDGRTYDCSPVIDADGTLLGRTRMVHILEAPCFHEQQYYAPGDLGAPVYDTRAGRIGVAICYDRHFPEYMRALALAGADLVVVPQAGTVDEWPKGFFEGEMCTAAFQNGYFIALCNRVGAEDRLTFAGESFVCGPEGGVRTQAPAGKDAILIADIDFADAAQSHARRYLLRDRRPELYKTWTREQ